MVLNFNERRKWTNSYEYMSEEDSDLYDEVRDSSEEKDKIIKKLLEDAAYSSRADHCASTY